MRRKWGISHVQDFGPNVGHDYDDIFYVRKYLEPARFKKLALGNWEMFGPRLWSKALLLRPEGATKVVSLQELVDAGQIWL